MLWWFWVPSSQPVLCGGRGEKTRERSSRIQELDVPAENGAVFAGDIAGGWTDAKKSSKKQESGSELPKRLPEGPRQAGCPSTWRRLAGLWYSLQERQTTCTLPLPIFLSLQMEGVIRMGVMHYTDSVESFIMLIFVKYPSKGDGPVEPLLSLSPCCFNE